MTRGGKHGIGCKVCQGHLLTLAPNLVLQDINLAELEKAGQGNLSGPYRTVAIIRGGDLSYCRKQAGKRFLTRRSHYTTGSISSSTMQAAPGVSRTDSITVERTDELMELNFKQCALAFKTLHRPCPRAWERGLHRAGRLNCRHHRLSAPGGLLRHKIRGDRFEQGGWRWITPATMSASIQFYPMLSTQICSAQWRHPRMLHDGKRKSRWADLPASRTSPISRYSCVLLQPPILQVASIQSTAAP